MAHIGSQEEIGFVSRSESIQGAEKRPSFFVSPRPSDPGYSLTGALERAFGSRSNFFVKLMSMEVPDTAYAQRYLLQMHRRNFKPLTIHQSFITLTRFLAFLTTTGKRCVGEAKRSDLEAFVEGEQDRGHRLSTLAGEELLISGRELLRLPSYLCFFLDIQKLILY